MSDSNRGWPEESVSYDYGRGKSGLKQVSEKEFENMVKKSLPSWNAIWNLVMGANKEEKKGRSGNDFGERDLQTSYKRAKESNLQKRIQKKIHDLVNEEEVLVEFYLKAAEAAKDKEAEFRHKAENLMDQIEKDKHLMRIVQDID